MVKRNGSLAGKGLEILYGKGVEDKETTTVSAAGVSGESAVPEEAETLTSEWAASLEAEAAAVTPQPVTDLFGAGPVSEDEDRPMAPEPEIEMMLLATTPVTEEVRPSVAVPPPPAATVVEPVGGGLPPLATTPVGEPAVTTPPVSAPPVSAPPVVEQPYALPQPPAAPMGGYTPPVQATTVTPEVVTPTTPRLVSTPKAVIGEPLYVTAPRTTAEQIESELGVGIGELPPEKLVDTDKNQPSRIRDEAEVLAAISPKERAELWKEIDTLYERVARELSTHRDQTAALALLREAQDILLEKPRQFDEARYKVGQVKTLLQRRQEVVSSIRSTAWWIFAYDIGWIVLLFTLVFFVDLKFSKPGAEALWNTLLWGGIGGVVGGFYGLYRHASELQDFDRNYTMWYVAQPIIGLLLGGAVHLILNAGLFAVNIEGSAEVIRWLPAFLAFLSGFRQRFVLDLIASIVDRLSPPRAKSSSPEEVAR